MTIKSGNIIRTDEDRKGIYLILKGLKEGKVFIMYLNGALRYAGTPGQLITALK